MDPARPATLYSTSLHRTSDGGATWIDMRAGLGTRNVASLALDPANPSKLYAGTSGSSVWSIDFEPHSFVVGPGPASSNPNRVRILSLGDIVRQDWLAYGAGTYGTEVACGDIDTATAEVVTGPGPGAAFGPQVRAFRASSAPLSKVNFYAYGTLKYGVQPAAADLDGDGHDEILTGPGPGILFGPHVRGFNYDGAALSVMAKISFFAYSTLKYGVNVAAGDLDVDGYAEILTGPGPSPAFAPQARGFNYDASNVTAISRITSNVFTASQYGLAVAAGDVDGDGDGNGLYGPGPALDERVRGMELSAGPPSILGGCDLVVYPGIMYGVKPGAGDIDGDTKPEVLAGQGASPSATSQIEAFDYTGSSLSLVPQSNFEAFAGVSLGVNLAAGPLGY